MVLDPTVARRARRDEILIGLGASVLSFGVEGGGMPYGDWTRLIEDASNELIALGYDAFGEARGKEREAGSTTNPQNSDLVLRWEFKFRNTMSALFDDWLDDELRHKCLRDGRRLGEVITIDDIAEECDGTMLLRLTTRGRCAEALESLRGSLGEVAVTRQETRLTQQVACGTYRLEIILTENSLEMIARVECAGHALKSCVCNVNGIWSRLLTEEEALDDAVLPPSDSWIDFDDPLRAQRAFEDALALCQKTPDLVVRALDDDRAAGEWGWDEQEVELCPPR
ncbi:MAG: hypothetical protein FJ009_19510 [Chloroflexi bacterium]|nr:hypothetical protein [Chloroflexota bacterium]